MKRRWVKWGGVVLALIAAAPIGGYLWLRTSLPQTTGELVLRGFAAPVEIMRDGNGVPHIFAKNAADAYRALGFVHAQDRLWQMEMMRRAGAGRLSEILGEPTLRADRFMRTLGLYQLAEKQIQRLPKGPREALEAYSAGVNAYLANHGGAWPLEFELLGHAPEPWRPVDSLLWGKLMGIRLATGWWGDLTRARLLRRVGADRLRELFPAEPLGTASAALEGLPLGELANGIPDWLISDSASNAWVLSGARTQSGKPILANDPHLGFAAPGVWYLARLVTPNWERVGVTAPGVPLTILGHNGKIAWGMTSTGGDTDDLFVEALRGDDPTRYLTPEGPKLFRTRTEIINVHEGDPETLNVRETRHGPVISDILAPAKFIAGKDRVVVLASTVLDPNDRTAEALFGINRATTSADLIEVSRLVGAPLQNLFVADLAGDIAMIVAGRVPIRRAGNGNLPVPGLHGRFDWSGDRPRETLPVTRNPANGLIANANQDPGSTKSGDPLSWYWPAGYRVERIRERLGSTRDHRIEDSRTLQMDSYSGAARRLLPHLLRVEPRGPAAKTAHRLLTAWDYRMRRGRPEPLIYAAWLRHLMWTLTADELGPDFAAYNRPRPRFVVAALTKHETWCDDVTTTPREDCGGRVRLALRRALAELTERFGEEIEEWRWGAAHRAVFPHRILRHVPILGGLAAGSIESDGGDHTLNRGQTGGKEPDPYRHTHGAGFRAVYDLAALGESRFSLATGQSGNPLSSRYMEFLRRWRDGRYIRITGDRATLRAAGADVLTIRPRYEGIKSQ